MKRVLFCATVDFHFKAFHLPYLQWFKEQGWEVHVAAKSSLQLPFVDHQYDLPIDRNPLKWTNYRAFRQLQSIIHHNHYEMIHCHTPVGGAIARLAARKARGRGTQVIYTAHGFHFCKGAPWKNWLIYYPIERWMSRHTDCLITINQEDYELARRHQFRAKQIRHVHGVGVDTQRFQPVGQQERQQLRSELGYASNDFLMIYAAEFNNNKNQQLLIQALSIILQDSPNARLLLAGEGPLLENCKELSMKLGVADRVDFLGYRTDLHQILPLCDAAVASSLREGLPVNIMEAMACGLPVIATQNRGHRELVHDNENGWIVSPHDAREMADKIHKLMQNRQLRDGLGRKGIKQIKEKYAVHKVLTEKSQIYRTLMGEEGMKWAAH